MGTIGNAQSVTCPGCGIGDVANQCWYTPPSDRLVPGALRSIDTLWCDACGLWIRDGVVVAHGVDLGPDDVVEIARRHAPEVELDALYVAPEERPLRLTPTVGVPWTAGVPWATGVSSITIHLARQRRRPDR